jgi:exosortase E/protease (VPEID-CTERM system)
MVHTPRPYSPHFWVLLAIILLEVGAVSIRFDASFSLAGKHTVPGAPGGASSALPAAESDGGRQLLIWTFTQMGLALKMSAATAAAIICLSGRRLREELHHLAGPSLWRWSWPTFAGHVAVMTLFWWLCRQLFEGPVLSSSWYPAWWLAWIASGMALLGLLVATALPPRFWGPLARPTTRALAGGLTVGVMSAGAGWLTSRLWMPLGRCTMDAVQFLLGLATTDLVYEPASFVIGTGRFAVRVGRQCSGYEGIGLIWVFLGAYLWVDRHRLRFSRAWLLLPLGAVAMFAVNVVRIASLIAVGTCLSAEVALDGFHSQAGWLGFLAVALGLVFLVQVTGVLLRADAAPAVGVRGPKPEAVYLTPLMAVVATGMIGAAFSTGGFDRYYPARLGAVAIPLWIYRREYAAMRWSCSWEAMAIGVLVFALWVVRWPGGLFGSPSQPSIGPGSGMSFVGAWLVARVVGSVITVPLAEELAFRGFLTRRLISADFDAIAPGRFTWTAFAVSSLAFGILHDRWLEGTMAGMLYALAYYRRGSLGDAVVAHATTNGLLSADALITGDWSLFS